MLKKFLRRLWYKFDITYLQARSYPRKSYSWFSSRHPAISYFPENHRELNVVTGKRAGIKKSPMYLSTTFFIQYAMWKSQKYGGMMMLGFLAKCIERCLSVYDIIGDMFAPHTLACRQWYWGGFAWDFPVNPHLANRSIPFLRITLKPTLTCQTSYSFFFLSFLLSSSAFSDKSLENKGEVPLYWLGNWNSDEWDGVYIFMMQFPDYRDIVNGKM